jgi:hypothetical protein
MFVSFYAILRQKIFWSSTPTKFSYEPPPLESREHPVCDNT